MESFVLNTIANFTKEKGYTYLKGEYLPTAKNEMVKNHYFHLGFEPTSQPDTWLLDVVNYTNKTCYIKTK